MRIAHVTDSYLPRVGGIELHVRDLARRERACGHDAVVLTSGRQPLGADPPVLAHRGYRGVLPPWEYESLRRTIASQAFDVVHAHASLISPMAWAAVRAALGSGVPAVVTMHSMVPAGGPVVSVLRALDREAGPDLVWTAVSEAAARPLREALPGRAVTVLRNGIDPTLWQPQRVPRQGGALTLVSVMRLSRRKRPVPLVKVLAAVRRATPSWQPLRAVVVGAGPHAAAARGTARRLGVADWVELPGALSHAEIHEVLTGADVFLAPARQESFGLAALEARCTGLPVVAMAQGGAGEFVRDGIEGFLVRDDDEMVRAVTRLVTTPELLRRMKQHNRSTLPPTTWSTVVAENLASYVAAGAVDRPRESALARL